MITFGFSIMTKKCEGNVWLPMVIIFLIFHFLFLTSSTAVAQRKELSQARTFIKNKKFDDAEKLIAPLLKDSANRKNSRLWEALYDIVHGKYAQANERLYLKQKQDTAAFFALARRMVSVAETLDSLTDHDRKSNSAEQHVHRVNLFNGGIYFVRKAKWKEAYDYMESYIDCARQPLFEAYHYDSLDQRMPQAGYWATYSGYRLHDPVLTLRHRELALRDSSKADFTLQFIAEARLWLKDNELYLQTLQEGFRRYPLFPYFFPRLFDVYTSRGEYDRALAVADSALAVSDSSQLFLFATSTLERPISTSPTASIPAGSASLTSRPTKRPNPSWSITAPSDQTRNRSGDRLSTAYTSTSIWVSNSMKSTDY